MKYRFTVNGSAVEVKGPGMRRLLDVLREDLGLTGTKEGCGEGACGACAVLLGDRPVNACLLLAENLLAAGRKEQAVNLYRRLRDTRTDPAEAHVRAAAGRALARAQAR